MELQVGVKALLQNKEGKYLLLRRSPDKYPEAGAIWDIVGGRIDPGSPLLENLKREIKEETGLDLTDEPKLIAAQDILRVPGRHVVRLTYTARIDGEPRIDADHTEYKWFTGTELKNLENLDGYFKELLDNGTIVL
ncbi:MAG: NUDIX domain-containing protein [Candidatus Liptonbacteria bacterium]|nr:NUDIX domain-containing protein [Candidatus Liptonbacteria bacterium]